MNVTNCNQMGTNSGQENKLIAASGAYLLAQEFLLAQERYCLRSQIQVGV